MPQYKYQREEILEIPEVQDMIDKARYSWLKALIAFLYLFGCRISEALKVKKKDIWLQELYLVARLGMKKQHTEMGPFKEVPHILRVPLKHPFSQYVKQHLDHVPNNERGIWMLETTPESSRVMATYQMKKLNRNCSPHLFRHSRLMKLALSGANAWELQDWAGWSDIRPARNYIRAAGTMAARLSDKVID